MGTLFALSFSLFLKFINLYHTFTSFYFFLFCLFHFISFCFIFLDSKSCADVYSVMRKDFWVVTPCRKTSDSSKVMEGTRLTVQYVDPEGFEFSIRTPGTPPRWKIYDEELQFNYENLLEEFFKEKGDRNIEK